MVEPIKPYRTPNAGESTKSMGESSCNNVALSEKKKSGEGYLIAARGSQFQRMIFSASEMEGF